ncbi:FAD-dependent oxidoreductase [Paenibacillus harenae]|uniref:2-polyprenyl-6-methoxyphenol hydroxylase-like FAD-dependent oxidoreductase n=1 Tax=Paenibacillus harenae TaxID=306543 RepID=A0ABT9TV15_PAEHA|nr:FAD dependent oxidoreductase [Paenibacillus harenae]MDQ0111197.1 2-polyprenyl-6-methoxyphenol hydroxylase-like FAD-dependent oxidoreductase [Paenibacillus harenae]
MTTYLNKSKAIVIGGGMAGLMTARVLSDHYGEVLIVEKDDFPSGPDLRPGTPQAFHPHRSTARGKSITERLFPGYELDLAAQGCPSSLNKDVYFLNQHGSLEMKYDRNDIKFSRAVLEWTIRQRVKAISNVCFLPRHDVIRLLTTPDRSAVTGVQVRDRDQSKQEKALTADLVIDTSGRSSKLSVWLIDLGYEVPKPDLLKVSLGYSTRRYKVPSHLTHLIDKWDVINLQGQPASGTFTGVFSFIEDQIAEVLLYRPGGNYPPTDAAEFELAVEQLPSRIISEIVRDLEPISSPRGFRIPELYCHRYEKMPRWPAGLLVLGDAYCIYDPIFGQGMTMAAIAAEILETCLSERNGDFRPDWEHGVLNRIKEAIEPAFWLNCTADLRWEGVEYEGSDSRTGDAFSREYMELCLKQATSKPDWQLYGLYWAVNTLSVSPRHLLNPQTAIQVLSASDEGKRLLAELKANDERSVEAILEELLPRFSETPFESAKQ